MPKSIKLFKNKEKARIYRKGCNERYYHKNDFGRNRRTDYTKEEELMIFGHKIRDVEIAKELGRSVRAIQVKRAKLKRFF